MRKINRMKNKRNTVKSILLPAFIASTLSYGFINPTIFAADGESTESSETYDENGFNSDGYNEAGFDISGYDIDGYDINGYNEAGESRDNSQLDLFYQANYLTQQPLIRFFPKDLSRDPITNGLPNPRAISNTISAQTGNTKNYKNLSDMFWLWGQFTDHDIDISLSDATKPAFINIPADDPQFSVAMAFTRSLTNPTGEQLNDITPQIDGSNIYGSSKSVETSLRTGSGGLFKVENNLLPSNPNSGMFLSGDIRVNENVALSSMHTIWVREHNRIATQLSNDHPNWTDEQLFNASRKVVVAQMQVITYKEFLPFLVGENALNEYNGYDESLSPQIFNSFSTAAYRFGHTMLSSQLLRVDENYSTIAAGNLPLQNAFFNPQLIKDHGIDSLLRGLSAQTAQKIDPLLVDDIRNFLFANVEGVGFDLATLNIQRGRDHLLPSYNVVRQRLGLEVVTSFNDEVFQEGQGAKLAAIYTSPDEIDLWVGGLAEEAEGDSLVGPVFTAIIVKQFENIRDGDPAWYENNHFTDDQLANFDNLSLADVIKRNTSITNLEDDSFVARSLPQARSAPTNSEESRVPTRDLDEAMQDAIDHADGME